MILTPDDVFIEGVATPVGAIVYRATRYGVKVELSAPPSKHTPENFPANRAKLLAILSEEIERRRSKK